MKGRVRLGIAALLFIQLIPPRASAKFRTCAVVSKGNNLGHEEDNGAERDHSAASIGLTRASRESTRSKVAPPSFTNPMRPSFMKL